MTSVHTGFNPQSHDLNMEGTAWRLLITKFSHDLRTPMCAIANGCESLEKIGSKLLQIMENDCMDPDRLKQRILEMNDTVAIMSGTTAFLNMMINRCLDYTVIANGESLRPQIGEVDLRQAVLTAVNCVESLHTSNSIFITNNQSQELPRHGSVSNSSDLWEELQSFGSLRADRQWLFEALLNLLSNAFKHGANAVHSKQRVHLMIGLEENAQVLRVSVSDHGEEISGEELQLLFSPPKISPAGGAGIGLFTMQQRLLVLGGHCGVTSRVDGNTFWFTMPTGHTSPTFITRSMKSEFELSSKVREEYERVYGSDKALSPILSSSTLMLKTSLSSDKLPLITTSAKELHLPEISRRSQSSSIVSNPSWRVLVVDDSLPSLKMTRRLLEGEGHIVTEALNGRFALQLLTTESEKRFDLVLMDLQMPSMDGFEATTALRLWESQQAAKNSSYIKDSMDKESTDYEGDFYVEDAVLPKVKVGSRSPSPAPGGLSLPPLNSRSRSPAASAKMMNAAVFFSSGPSAASSSSSLSPLSPSDRRHRHSAHIAPHPHVHAHVQQELPPLPPLIADRRSPVTGNHSRSGKSSKTVTPISGSFSSTNKHLIVGCSAATDPILLQEALFVGMDDFVSKPLTLSALSLLAKKHGLQSY